MAVKKKNSLHIKFARKIGKVKKDFSKGKNRKTVIGVVSIIVLGALAYLFRSFIFTAFVNGYPVMRWEYVAEMEKAVGDQTLDNLITKKLILQEAVKEELVIDEAEVTSEIATISAQLESQGTNLDLALSMQGVTREELRENIYMQLAIEKLLEDRVLVADEEVAEFFETNKDYYENETLETVGEEIKNQLKQQKLSEEYQTWIEELKTNSNIYYFTDL